MGEGAGSGAKDAPGTLRPGTLTALLQEIAEAPASALGSDWGLALRPGAVVGRFELVRELGRGGFGVVWEAKDRELGRSVALKAVRTGGRTAVREERLLREAEAAARLSHPNLVTLFDVGRAEQGPYLVLELLHGETLEERLVMGPLSVPDAVRLATDVARGVAHAPGQGVVHRDLKPANVFLCEDGRAKVLDFGLAHAFGQRRADGGTSGYMAPEQVEGAPEDERTDVWALGVMLFEMLSGRRPFGDDRALRRPAPVLEVPGLPALGALVARMLSRRPVDRPRDGGEVLEALSAMERELERARATAGPVRTRRRSGVPRAGLLAAGIALGAVVAFAGSWWAQRAGRPTAAPSTSEPVALAVLPLANLSGDAAQEYFSDGMTEEIIGKLSRLRGLAVTARSSVARYKGSRKDAREIGRELGVAYLLDGSVRRVGDRIRVSATLVKTADAFQVWSESIDATLDDIFEVQERVATRIVEALQVHLSPEEAGSLGRWGTRNAAAYDEYLRGQALVEHFHLREKLEAARSHFERALQIDPAFAPAMAGLASAEAQVYRNVDSTPTRLARARALLERALAIDPRLPRALFTSGEIRGVSYDYRGAAEDFRRVTAVEPRNFADGVAEEILNALTHVRGLKVVGRTSSFSFKGKKDDLRTIGRKLGVATVLEGSVRKEGGRIRVTAQLVKAQDGFHLWSESYDRELTGIFGVQEEIARAVVSALEVKLLAGGASDSPRPITATTPEAYQQYLIGRQFYRRFSFEGFRRAIQAYERALELDPLFAPAWAGLGIPIFYSARQAPTREEERSRQLRALAAAERAVELAPDLVDALSVRGFLRNAVAWDWEGGRADLERAVQLSPSDADAWRRLGVVLDNLGRTGDAIAAAERAVRLDPLGHSVLKLGQLQQAAGRLDLARASFQRAVEILPDSSIPSWNLGGVWLLEGRAREALDVFEKLASVGVNAHKDVARALHSLGRTGEAEAALEGLKSRQPGARPLDVASVCAWMERSDCAFAWLERAFDERDGEMGEAFRTSPEWRSLHADPRWKALLRKMNLPLD